MTADPTTHDLAHALALLARTAAAAAAPYLRRSVRTGAPIETKTDFHDPVTIHDRTVEAALRVILGSVVPGSRLLGEEAGEGVLDGAAPLPEDFPIDGDEAWGKSAAFVAGLSDRVRWIVDPIDGTANFAAGLPWFNTSIGVELDGVVVAGVVSAPMTHELFIADDRDAWYEGPDGSAPLDAAGPSTEAEAVLNTYYPGLTALHVDPEVAVRHQTLLTDAYQSTRRYGASALDLAHVAAGWLGATMGVRFKPWDVAAGIHLVRVAGGRVLNIDTGEGLPDGLRGGLVASGANLDAVTAKRVLSEAMGLG